MKRATGKRVTIVENIKDDEDSDSPYTTRSGRVRVPIRKTPRKSLETSHLQFAIEDDEENASMQSPFKQLIFSSSEEDAEDVVPATPVESVDQTRKRKRSTFELEETINGREKLKRHSEKFIINTPKAASPGESNTETPNKRLTFELEESVVLETAKKNNKSVQFNVEDAPKPPKLERASTFTKDEENTEKIEETSMLEPRLERSNTFTMENSFALDVSNVTLRRKHHNSSIIESPLKLDDQSMPEISFQTSSAEESISPKKSFNLSYKNVKSATPKFKNLERFRVSTPLSAKKLPAVRNTSLALQKEKNRTFNESLNDLSTSIKRTKLPNFAKIHQKALDRSEDILEMTQRKEQRAKLLMSGHKPPASTSMRKKSPRKSSPKAGPSKTSKKQLNFNKAASKILMESKIPSRKPTLALATAKRELKIEVRENGTTRFGFKQKPAVSTLSRENLIKTVVNKSKIQENSLDNRRNVIKGVRSNRRFELLMSMRNNK